MLIRLNNGIWIDPWSVTAIARNTVQPEGITIHLKGGFVFAGGEGDIEKIADNIAGLLNDYMEVNSGE